MMKNTKLTKPVEEVGATGKLAAKGYRVPRIRCPGEIPPGEDLWCAFIVHLPKAGMF